MPHWDFKCSRCGSVYDLFFASHAAMESDPHKCPKGYCGGQLQRQPSASTFKIADQVITKRVDGFKVETTRPYKADF